METVSFTRMDQGSAEEYAFLDGLHDQVGEGLADRVLDMLRALAGPKRGYQVDRYEHSLQTATRAQRDGADEECVVCALLHDIGDLLAPENHSQLAAAVLRPYVAQENHWVIAHHGIFQGYYYFHHLGRDREARERLADHPAYRRTVEFCESWDQRSFDPDYDTLPLEAFEPMVRRLFARQPTHFV